MSTSGKARVLDVQAVHYIRKTVNFNDIGISAGVKFGTLPKGAVVIGTVVQIVTAFNAATTNVLTVGGATNFNEHAASGDVAPGTVAVTRVTKGGNALTVSADADLYVKYTQTGTAATAGKAVVIVEYIPDNDQ